jgi:hypothetical protein
MRSDYRYSDSKSYFLDITRSRSSHKRFGEWTLLIPGTCAFGKAVNERSLRRHRDPSLSGKLLRMMTAMQAFGWCHQYSIADLLIARDMGCELFTSGLDASRFAPAVRFGQSFHLGIHAHIQPHYGMAIISIDQGRPNAY